MSDWTSGYVADIGYTHGFYRELTPAILAFAALAAGIRAPDVAAPLSYCELGCGQGFSANVLAAANPHIRFHATDFNPSHVAGARDLAAKGGLGNISFYDTPFAEFSAEPGLPQAFDIIALHGIYSWISPENRRHIIDFISRRLRVGGVVYVSYNCLPGWAAAAPMRHLMALHARAHGGPTAGRIEPALGFVQRVQKANAGYFRAAPGLAQRLEQIKAQDRRYLAHEYFNDAWQLFYHSDVAAEMGAARLSYLGSAHLLEQVDAINLSSEQQEILAGLGDPSLRETVRDFMTNAQFRRDIYVKGPLPISARVQHGAWQEQRFALSSRREDIEAKVRGPLGEASLQAEVYEPVLERLSTGPMDLRELLAGESVSRLGISRVRQALMVLVGIGHVQPCLPARGDAERTGSVRDFNRAVMSEARSTGTLGAVASPVTGGGIGAGRFQQLFLLALAEGHGKPEAWAEFAWRTLEGQGERLRKEGRILDAAEDNLAELRAEAQRFAQTQLPLLRTLGVA
ncbi:class I SAM-dependent methyltransferase [Xanthobacter sp. V2C-4]|uniref:class I SAM-dependent methyltransferase n=1 Tax=Xanthobacter albus TaxID=3119929 RepID=UPI00372B45EA